MAVELPVSMRISCSLERVWSWRSFSFPLSKGPIPGIHCKTTSSLGCKQKQIFGAVFVGCFTKYGRFRLLNERGSSRDCSFSAHSTILDVTQFRKGDVLATSWKPVFTTVRAETVGKMNCGEAFSAQSVAGLNKLSHVRSVRGRCVSPSTQTVRNVLVPTREQCADETDFMKAGGEVIDLVQMKPLSDQLLDLVVIGCGPAGANVGGSRASRLELTQEPRYGGTEESNDRKKLQFCGNADFCPLPVKRAATVASSRDKWEQPLRQSRREWLLSTATLAVVVVPGSAHGLNRLYDVADDSGAGNTEVAPAAPSAQLNAKVQSMEDISTWYRFRGEGFALRIPPGYQDILDPVDEEALNNLYGERAKDRPFAARFASPDSRDEVLSVVIKPASEMRLSFFETKDIKELGTIKEAAPKFLPGGAKLVAARIINSTKSRIPRTYYMYEFVANDKHVAMSAGVASGRVFVLGATAPESKWKDAGDKLRLAASSFYLP